MTSHRISHLAAALAGVLTMSGIATQVLAQEIRGDQLDESTVHRRAIEAVVWGMPAVNAQLMFVDRAGVGRERLVLPRHRPRPEHHLVVIGTAVLRRIHLTE